MILSFVIPLRGICQQRGFSPLVHRGAELIVELPAADGRDIWYINTGAPSLRTGIEADFILQVRCRPSPLRPLTMGGLLLWSDPANFVRLDWGDIGRRRYGD
jgi:hypothetical protein